MIQFVDKSKLLQRLQYFQSRLKNIGERIEAEGVLSHERVTMLRGNPGHTPADLNSEQAIISALMEASDHAVKAAQLVADAMKAAAELRVGPGE